ncbi:MAG TPA: hypothetical protein VHZ31_08155 [Solirubrobacteraceae bacterium]|nr:hypothetical protein [Solirubrobacteraceae bacterium]
MRVEAGVLEALDAARVGPQPRAQAARRIELELGAQRRAIKRAAAPRGAPALQKTGWM